MQIYYLNSKGLKYISQICGVEEEKIAELNKDNQKNFVYVPNNTNGIFVLGNYDKEKLIVVDADDDIPELKKKYNLKGEVQIGDMYLIPSSEKYVVQPLDTLDKICDKFGLTSEYLKEKNNLKTSKLFIGQILQV